MKIGIDVRMIFPFPTGIGNYRKSLISALLKIDSHNEYLLVGNVQHKELVMEFTEKFANVKFAEIKSPANHPLQHLSLRSELKKMSLSFFWTTPWGATIGLPCKYVITIHDLIYHHYPKFGSWKSSLYQTFLEKSVARKADAIVTISDFVKNDIVTILGVDASKITNIQGAVASGYGVIKDKEFIENVLEKYGMVGAEYFVYLGNQRPHKNLVGLLKSFEVFRRSKSGSEVKLVIIGGVDAKGRDEDSKRISDQLNHMKFKDDVMLLGKVFDDREVAAIFNRAISLVHPSLHEGFGLTPLEAMTCSCPVISSKITSIPEVVDDAGILIDPNSIEEISDAMIKIYSDKELQGELSKRALQRSKMFSWEKTARMLLAVFQSIN